MYNKNEDRAKQSSQIGLQPSYTKFIVSQMDFNEEVDISNSIITISMTVQQH